MWLYQEQALHVELGVTLLLLGAFFAALPWIDRDSRVVRRLFFYLNVYLLIRYVAWRLFASLGPFNTVAGVWGLTYFLIECRLSWASVRSGKLFSQFTDRTPEVEANRTWYERLPSPPIVDLLIPTYNENYSILERAIVSASVQSYPHTRVWVLDDGQRDWLRELAHEKGVHYLRRDSNAGFKAGNINNALDVISKLEQTSQFIAVLDCDFVAGPKFVERTLALMHDDSVGIVQSKQIYYNLDPFQYALPGGRGIPDWQRFAFDYLAPCLDVYYAQTCCGTCFLARRASLESIGGIPTDSVAEDALTSYALQDRGIKTAYLAEALSYGIVAEGLAEFLNQCGRWCLGRVQNNHSTWGGKSPLKTRQQRFDFCVGNVMWGVYTATRIFFLWIPIVFMICGVSLFSFRGSAEGYVLAYLPSFLFSTLIGTWMTRATTLPIVDDARQLVWAAVVMRATLRGLFNSKNAKFDVTDKGAVRSKVFVHWKPLKWLLLTGGLTLIGFLKLAYSGHRHGGAYEALCVFWGFYNLLCITTAAAVCVEPPQRRADERFPTAERGWLTSKIGGAQVSLVDISQGGACIESSVEYRIGEWLELDLESADPMRAVVVRHVGERRVAIRFELTSKQRERMIHKLFSDRYINPIVAGQPSLVYAGILRNLLL